MHVFFVFVFFKGLLGSTQAKGAYLQTTNTSNCINLPFFNHLQ